MKFYNKIKNENIKILNKVKVGEIFINGNIGEDIFDNSYSFRNFQEDIEKLKGSEIIINIKSYGGDLFEALAIYDFIRNIEKPVTTKIVGSTASAGTIISLAGDTRLMTENSKYLIHKPMISLSGNSDDFKQNVEEVLNHLESLDKQLINLYESRSNLKYETILALMQEEKFISAEEALEYGFIDEIIKTQKDMKIKNEKKDQDPVVNPEVETGKEVEVVNEETETEVEPTETETEVEPTVEKLIKENEELKAKILELEEKLMIEEAEMKAESITNFIDEQIKLGTITNETKEQWFSVAEEKGLDVVKLLVNSIPQNKSFKTVINKKINVTKKDVVAQWKSGKISTQDYLNFIK